MQATGSWSIGKRIVVATAIAGALDIGMAAIETALNGKSVGAMLRGVASGPFPGASNWGVAGSAVGLLVHFTIMTVMAAVFIWMRERVALVRANTLAAAALYGVVLWLVMYGLVLHLRFGAHFPSADPIAIAKQLFAHVVLVGLVIGLVARR